MFRIIRRTLSTSIVDVPARVSYLCKTLCLPPSAITSIAEKLPYVLTTPDTTLTPKLDYLNQALDISPSALGKFILANPKILGLSTTENVAPSLQAIKARLQLTTAQLSKVVTQAPRLLSLNTQGVLTKIDYLQQRLDLTDNDLKVLLVGSPYILQQNLDSTIIPKLAYLTTNIGGQDDPLTTTELRKFIMKLPHVFTYSTTKNLEPKLKFLKARLLFTDAELRRFTLANKVFPYSMSDKFEPVLALLTDRLDLDPEELKALVLALPTILNCSPGSNIEPTISFYENILTKPVARQFIIDNPFSLSFSLRNRLIPRWAEMEAAGGGKDAETLKIVAKASAKKFEDQLKYTRSRTQGTNRRGGTSSARRLFSTLRQLPLRHFTIPPTPLPSIPPQLIFDIVTDVTSYQTFVPHVTSSCNVTPLLSRSEITFTPTSQHPPLPPDTVRYKKSFHADLTIGYPSLGLTDTYTSKVVCHKHAEGGREGGSDAPVEYTVLARDCGNSKYFQGLGSLWSIRPLGEGEGSCVEFSVWYTVAGTGVAARSVDFVVQQGMEEIARRQMEAFISQCKRVNGS